MKICPLKHPSLRVLIRTRFNRTATILDDEMRMDENLGLRLENSSDLSALQSELAPEIKRAVKIRLDLHPT